MTNFDYYYSNPDINYYFSINTLFSSSFETLSVSAKVLYALMLERANLSNKNHWFDEQNRVYIIYTAKHIIEQFHCSEHTALKLLKELDEFGLIERQYRKKGQPCLIFVKLLVSKNDIKCDAQEAPESKKEEKPAPVLPEKKSEIPSLSESEKPDRSKCTSEQEYAEKRKAYLMAKMNIPTTSAPSELPAKNTVTDCKNCGCHLQNMQSSIINNSINNNINHHYNSYLSYQSYLYNKKIDVVDTDEINNVRENIKKNIEYFCFQIQKTGEEMKMVDNIVEIIVNVMTSKKPTIRIAGEERAIEAVKNVYSKLNLRDIDYVLRCVTKVGNKITNMIAYMRTALYNAKQSQELHYQQKMYYRNTQTHLYILGGAK